MRNIIPLEGRRFGRLLVLSEAELSPAGSTRWLCRCDCGLEKIVHGQPLREGKTLSCGCLRKDNAAARIAVRVGQRYSRYVVLRQASNDQAGTRWYCRCDCGVEKIVSSRSLRAGTTMSCGCYLKEIKVTHGQSRLGEVTVEYLTWSRMIARCENPKTRNFDLYGGRGIRVCTRWRNSFEAFFEDMGPRPPRHSIDRIDVNGDYEQSNCRWTTMTVQSRNRRNNRWLEYRGERRVLSDWATILGIGKQLLRWRLQNGWSVERALETPLQPIAKGEARNELDSRWVEYKGDRRLLTKWAEQFGIEARFLVTRLNAGWTPERAFETPLRKDIRRKAEDGLVAPA